MTKVTVAAIQCAFSTDMNENIARIEQPGKRHCLAQGLAVQQFFDNAFAFVVEQQRQSQLGGSERNDQQHAEPDGEAAR